MGWRTHFLRGPSNGFKCLAEAFLTVRDSAIAINAKY